MKTAAKIGQKACCIFGSSQTAPVYPAHKLRYRFLLRGPLDGKVLNNAKQGAFPSASQI